MVEMAKVQLLGERIGGLNPTEEISPFFIIYSFWNTVDWSY